MNIHQDNSSTVQYISRKNEQKLTGFVLPSYRITTSDSSSHRYKHTVIRRRLLPIQLHEISPSFTQKIVITKVQNLGISSLLDDVSSKRYKVTITKTRKIGSLSIVNLSPELTTSLRVKATRKKLHSVKPVRVSSPPIIEMTTKVHKISVKSNDHKAFNRRKNISTITTEAFPVTITNQFLNFPLTQMFDDVIVNRNIISARKMHTDGKNNETTIIPSKTFITLGASGMKDIEHRTLEGFSNRHQVDPIISTILRSNHISTVDFMSDTISSDILKCSKETLIQVSMQSSDFKQYNVLASDPNIENSLKIEGSNPTDALLELSVTAGYIHQTKISEIAMTSASVSKDGNMISYNLNEAYIFASRLNPSQILYSNENVYRINFSPILKLTENIITSTRLRTYTYVVTKINEQETEVTSSTTVRPHVKFFTLTVPVTVSSVTATDLMSHSSVLATTQSDYHGKFSCFTDFYLKKLF